MGLLNWTTTVSVERTVAEIQKCLVRAKAQAVLTEYDGSGNIVALSFRLNTTFGQMAFKLPADAGPVQAVLKQQANQRVIPKRYAGDVTHARRVAWRIVKDWVEAQLALVETRMATPEQVFLPYAQDINGQTFYDRLRAERFNGLALPAPEADRK